MTFSLSKIDLFSQNPKELAYFFNEAMDAFVEQNNEGHFLVNLPGEFNTEGIVIEIFEEKKNKNNSRNTRIEFCLDSEESLKDFYLKCEFYLFKSLNISKKQEKLSSFIESSQESYFELIDPDARAWRFSYSPVKSLHMINGSESLCQKNQ